MSRIIAKQPIYNLAIERLTAYAKEVVLDRAVCDYRDGLKPVHRRLLWAMYEGGFRSSGSFIKCARIVGDTMGKYHPHGDASIYDALVNMVANSSVPLIKGQGNFGNKRGDPPAADRYTEAKMSKVCDALMFSDYINTAPLVPNYDNKDKEPIFLPALFPNLLLNGCQGIAYGLAANIPPMHPEPVMKLIQQCLRGKTITGKDVMTTLRFNWPDPCNCVTQDEKIMAWLEKGRGPLYFQPDYEYDERKRTITFHYTPPNFNFKTVSKALLDKPWIADFEDLTDKKSKGSVTLRVQIKGGNEDFEKRLQDVVKIFTNTFATSTIITTRGASLEETTFTPLTISEFIHLWTNYRVRLEQDYQTYKIAEYKRGIALQDLLMLVIKNLEKVTPIIKSSSQPARDLQNLLSIDEEQAGTVLGFTLRKLSRIDRAEIMEKKTELVAKAKQAETWRDNPKPKVSNDLNSYGSIIRVQ